MIRDDSYIAHGLGRGCRRSPQVAHVPLYLYNKWQHVLWRSAHTVGGAKERMDQATGDTILILLLYFIPEVYICAGLPDPAHREITFGICHQEELSLVIVFIVLRTRHI